VFRVFGFLRFGFFFGDLVLGVLVYEITQSCLNAFGTGVTEHVFSIRVAELVFVISVTVTTQCALSKKTSHINTFEICMNRPPIPASLRGLEVTDRYTTEVCMYFRRSSIRRIGSIVP
jgi:hypothetical protein